jgi:hypothetical protein
MTGSQEERRAAIRDILVDVAQKGTRENKHLRNVKRAWVALPVAVATLALTAGGFAVAQFAHVTDKNSVSCFARAELNWLGEFPGTHAASAGDGSSDGPVSIEDAKALCGDLWKQNVLDATTPSGTTGPGAYDRTFSHPVPSPLTVCVMGDGTAAVVPGDEHVCAKLGLSARSQ